MRDAQARFKEPAVTSLKARLPRLLSAPVASRLPTVLGGIAALALAGYAVVLARGARSPSLRAPDLALLFSQPPAILIHITGALTALMIGTALLIGVKGNRLHRAAGWAWVVAMAVTAVSSLFIRQVNHGAFSLIRLLSGWTIIALPMAVHAARRHRVAAHRKAMTGMFVGGLLLAGALAALPGRLLWMVFVG